MRLLRGLRAQILLLTILPLILVLIGVSVGSINVHQQSMRRLVAERDARLVQVAAARLDDGFRERLTILQAALGEAEGEAGASPPPVRVSPLPTHFDLGLEVFDAEGRPAMGGTGLATASLPANGVSSLRNIAAVDDISNAARKQPGVPVVVAAPGDESSPIVVVGLAGTKSQGVAIGASSAEAVGLPALIAQLKAGPRATAFLVDRAGRVVFHPDPTLAGRDVLGSSADLQLRSGRAGALFQHAGGGTEEHVVGYAPVDAAGWYLVVEEPWADMLEPVLQYTLMAPLVVLVAAIFSLAAVYFGLRRIVQPLQTLGHRASRLAWGDFEAIRAPVGGIGEIEELQRTLQEMAEQVRRYQAGMQDYIAALTRAQEEERRRLARDLHDETVQSLVALYQRVKLLEVDLDESAAHESGGAVVEARLRELSAMVDRTLNEVRQFVRALRPIYLEELGLVPALEMLVKTTQRDGLAVSLETAGAERRLPADVELAVYRIGQEGLHNVARHAAAGRARLGLTFADEGVTLSVEDDGTGFTPPETPDSLAADGHFGLMGMYERATRVGGHLSIRSAPHAGTKVVAFLPEGRYETLSADH